VTASWSDDLAFVSPRVIDVDGHVAQYSAAFETVGTCSIGERQEHASARYRTVGCGLRGQAPKVQGC
jgi:hypothetical protein